MAFSFSQPYSLYPFRKTSYPPLFHTHFFTPLPTFSTSQAIPKPPLMNNKVQCVKEEQASRTPGIDPKTGVALYKPKSYEVLVTDAANSLDYALEDGKIRLEIDFPYVFLPSYF